MKWQYITTLITIILRIRQDDMRQKKKKRETL